MIGSPPSLVVGGDTRLLWERRRSRTPPFVAFWVRVLRGRDCSHLKTWESSVARRATLVVRFCRAKRHPGAGTDPAERLRRTRHAAQYFDPSSAEVSADDSAWAMSMAQTVVDAVERLLTADPPELFA